jgi:hypothetical protein
VSSTSLRKNWTKNLSTIQSVPVNWTNNAGTFKTSEQLQFQLILPELHEGRTICGKAHVATALGIYNLIKGRHLLMNLVVILNFQTQMVECDDMEIPT